MLRPQLLGPQIPGPIAQLPSKLRFQPILITFWKLCISSIYILRVSKNFTACNSGAVYGLGMLFAVVPTALLATRSALVAHMHQTLLLSAALIFVLQFVRGISTGTELYSTFMAGVLTLMLVPAVAVVLVAFGAPVLYSQVETLLLALVLSGLSVQPLLTQYGIDSDVWKQVIGFRVLNQYVFGSFGALVGAWFGAIPITLDWDQPWQQYPITVVLGAYCGSAVGNLLGTLFNSQPFRKRVESHRAKTQQGKKSR